MCIRDSYIVEGGRRLAGSIEPGGNKNAALPIIAASLLTDQTVILDNVPRIRDTEVLVDLVKSVGAEAAWSGTNQLTICLLYTSPSPRDRTRDRMPSSA